MGLSSSKGQVRRDAEFIEALTRIGGTVLQREFKVDSDTAAQAMRAIVNEFCTEFARSNVYIPVDRDGRNRVIVRQYQEERRGSRPYSADRVHELAKEHALTTRAIYKIIRDNRLAVAGAAPAEA